MADLSNQSVLGIAKETVPGTYVAPTNSDLLRVSDLRITINGLTVNVNEFTGSIHRPGPVVLGKTFEVSGKIYLRGPGGSVPPAADAFLLGRILQAAGFDETRIATAVPPTAAAVGSGTTTSVTLGAAAAGTLDLYKGAALFVSDFGAIPKALVVPRSYSAAKLALLSRVAGVAIAGNYQVPLQLSYRLNATATPPSLSASVWHGSRRYNGNGLAISSFRINLPTAGRESQELPSIDFTLSGDLQSDADEASPVPPAGLAIPPFRDGSLFIAGRAIGATSVTIDLGAEIGYPPNPNRASGNDAAQLTGTTRTVSLTMQQVQKSQLDLIALADGQLNYGLEATYGFGTGNFFCIGVSDMRFNYQNPDNTGAFVNTTGEAYVDGANRDISISIPFY